MAVDLLPLPYSLDSMEPYVSERAMACHYEWHHRAYIRATNELIQDTAFDDMALDDVIVVAANDPGQRPLFNNAAQVWNHNFFWQSMKPGGGGLPPVGLARRLAAEFGTLDRFKELFKGAAVGHFGSGWIWLVLDQDRLRITTTANATPPFLKGVSPLLVCDVWEHAYYLDYQHRRGDFAQVFLDKLVDWDFVRQNLDDATAVVAPGERIVAMRR